MFIRELVNSLRSLSKVKVYALTIISTLGVTLGILVAIFNLNFQILAAPLPYPHAEQLYVSKGALYNRGQVEFDDFIQLPVMLEAYQTEKTQHVQTAMFAYEQDVIRHLADTPRANITYTTPEFMPLLGFTLELGRIFNEQEALNTHTPSAIISYQTWQTRFAARSSIIGETLQIGEVNFRIVGVLAKNNVEPEIQNPGRLTDIWLPWDYFPGHLANAKQWGLTGPDQHLLVKLNSAVDAAKLNQQWTTHYNDRFKTENASRSFFNEITISFELNPLNKKLRGDSATLTLWLFVGAFFLLLIACTNIANLILARTVNQQRNMSINAALGAQKHHLIKAIFTELLVLSLCSALIAMLIAQGCYSLLRMISAENLPGVMHLSFDLASVLFCLVCAITLALLGAWLISNKIDFKALNNQMRTSGKGTGMQIKSSTRKALIFSQVCLATILLIASVQIFIGAFGVLSQQPNFTSENRYEVQLNQLFEPWPTLEEASGYYRQRRQQLFDIAEQLRQDPRIESLSLTTGTPVNERLYTFLSADAAFTNQISVVGNLIDDHYFRTLNIKLLKGRAFTAQDITTQPNTMVVNQAMAQKIQADGDVIGQRFYWLNGQRTDPYEIIGVTENLNLPDQENLPRMWTTQRLERYLPAFVINVKQNQTLDAASLNKVISSYS